MGICQGKQSHFGNILARGRFRNDGFDQTRVSQHFSFPWGWPNHAELFQTSPLLLYTLPGTPLDSCWTCDYLYCFVQTKRACVLRLGCSKKPVFRRHYWGLLQVWYLLLISHSELARAAGMCPAEISYVDKDCLYHPLISFLQETAWSRTWAVLCPPPTYSSSFPGTNHEFSFGVRALELAIIDLFL